MVYLCFVWPSLVGTDKLVKLKISLNMKLSTFTKIIGRDLPAYIVAEDAEHIAFLDIAPITTGHTLVVPKQQVDYLFDLEDRALGSLICFAKKVAKGLRKTVPCKRIGMLVLGLEVPHAHIHLVPIVRESDLDLHRPKLSLDSELMERIASKIRKAI